jgi:putative endonuclease
MKAHMKTGGARAAGRGERLRIELQRWLLDGLAALARRRWGSPAAAAHLAGHLEIGLRGETAALFELRRLGYMIVARRWTSPRALGDVDLIGWQGEWLCFIEVKTRTERNWVPAEFAVDEGKEERLRRLARAYLRGFELERRRGIQVRFDVVSVYLPQEEEAARRAEIEVRPAAFPRRRGARPG